MKPGDYIQIVDDTRYEEKYKDTMWTVHAGKIGILIDRSEYADGPDSETWIVYLPENEDDFWMDIEPDETPKGCVHIGISRLIPLTKEEYFTGLMIKS
jgi:hypothetical protein